MFNKENFIERNKEQIKIKEPIIDIIRHGRTKYKEALDKSFKFDTKSNDFGLTPEKLDLTSEGIIDLENTANQLLDLIDKENEVVILVTSPSFRAQSSLLIIKNILEKEGIDILNPQKILKTKQLRPLDLKDLDKDKDEFMKETMVYMKEGDNAKKPIDEIKEDIAFRMGREFGDLYAEDSFDKVNERFERFIRHMRNIQTYLSIDTKNLIENKQLRVICLAHEELPVRFMKKVFGKEVKLNMKNGQILEITNVPNKDKLSFSASLYSKDNVKDKIESVIG